ncbi:hypothetical protein TVAG_374950 [Trichomonas vaginalis G3]|uniref:Glycosyltransferase 61 catalytic domain-containing protein n=1 Tax=Trichomonas vaginalis (strain ATCC PRA-98 / G3) TaxID=412133 RepID=A2FUR0_TRIV3|nr:glycosyltransferase family [Trichomonas vaginalis G3]EAX91349.1 hypothetical protein TVAG_374950 [Trichomonas vaginalis G3]KAI5504241.1 glycosyltransferase family [Trichomonas vaginalis G3]|eukprot:XP_001304279.1 hypothetical protein [Trichomonas vaginalis G3]
MTCSLASNFSNYHSGVIFSGDPFIPVSQINNGPITYTKSKENLIEIIPLTYRFQERKEGRAFFFTKNREHAQMFENFYEYYPKMGNWRYTDFYNEVNCKIYVYRNCYATFNGEFSNGTHIIRPPYDTAKNWIRNSESGNVIASYNYAMVFGHALTENILHLFCDTICPLLAVPQYLSEKAQLIIFGLPHIIKDICDVLDIPPDRYTIINKGEWIAAQHLIVAAEPRPHVSHYGPLPSFIAEKVRKKYHLEHVIPTKYVFLNRDGKVRQISNIEEIMNEARKMWPNINWTQIPDTIPTFQESAIIWSPIKFVFTITGSQIFRCIFMQPGTAMVVLFLHIFDTFVTWFINSMDIRTITFASTDKLHWGSQANNFDIKECMRAIEVALYNLDHNNTWPEVDPSEGFPDYYPWY